MRCVGDACGITIGNIISGVGECVCVCAGRVGMSVAVIIFNLVCTMNIFWRPRLSDLTIWEISFACSTSF